MLCFGLWFVVCAFEMQSIPYVENRRIVDRMPPFSQTTEPSPAKSTLESVVLVKTEGLTISGRLCYFGAFVRHCKSDDRCFINSAKLQSSTRNSESSCSQQILKNVLSDTG